MLKDKQIITNDPIKVNESLELQNNNEKIKQTKYHRNSKAQAYIVLSLALIVALFDLTVKKSFQINKLNEANNNLNVKVVELEQEKYALENKVDEFYADAEESGIEIDAMGIDDMSN